MPPVTNTIKRPDGTAYTSGRVVIDLVGTNGTPLTGGYVTASNYTIESSFVIETLTAGVWSQTLVANELINPAGTAWRITEQVDGRNHVYYVDVPNGAGPYFVEDILTEAPASIASSALSAHITDTDAHAGHTLTGLYAGAAAGYDVLNDAVLAAALSAATEGDTIHLPVGLYQFTSLPVVKGVTIKGAGRWSIVVASKGDAQWAIANYGTNFGGTVLACTATSGNAVEFDGAGSKVIQADLRDLMVLGPGSGTSVGISHGTASTPVARCGISNVTVANFATGLVVHCEEGNYQQVAAVGCQKGAVIADNNNYFAVLSAQACSTTGVEISGVGNLLDAPLIQANTGVGLRFVNGGNGNRVQTPYFENVAGSGAIVGDVGADFNTVDGMHCGTVADTVAFAGNANNVSNPQADNGVTFSAGGIAIGTFSAAVTGASVLLNMTGGTAWDLGGRDLRIHTGQSFIFESSGSGSTLSRTADGFTKLGGGAGGALYLGSGTPSAGLGTNGDVYIDKGGTASGKTVLYHREAGAWVALVP